jgi:hypothetical protein
LTEAEALQLVKDIVPVLQEPTLDEAQYTRQLALNQVSATEWRIKRTAAAMALQKCGGSAEYHDGGVNDDQEDDIHNNWVGLYHLLMAEAAAEEAVTEGDIGNMTRTRSVANLPVW